MKKAVLLIEDNSLLANLYTAGLKKEGLEVIVSHNGEDGLRIIEEHMPDIVLLDLNIPLMNGFEVLEKIRNNPKTKDLKVVVITLDVKEEDRKRIESFGVSDYIIKTEISLEDLVKKVLHYLTT